MKCSECNTDVKKIGKRLGCYEYLLVDKRLVAATHSVPFYCNTCGAIKFIYTAVRGVIFVLPIYKYTQKSDKLSNILIIPQEVKQAELSSFGIILSAGPGFYNKKNKWINVNGLYPGMKVIYDASTPWNVDVLGNDGKKHLVKLCDVTDVMVEIV